MTQRQEKLIENYVRTKVRTMLKENQATAGLEREILKLADNVKKGVGVDQSSLKQYSTGDLIGMLLAQTIYSTLSKLEDKQIHLDAKKHLNWKL